MAVILADMFILCLWGHTGCDLGCCDLLVLGAMIAVIWAMFYMFYEA